MKIKLGFITGARSDYGVTKNLIQKCVSDKRFEVKIFVTGMHLLEKFGNTYEEVLSDNFSIYKKIPTYNEHGDDKRIELSKTINCIYEALLEEDLDAVYLVGDRIEAYGSALALHFLKIPVLHYAGGQITKGAVDNIYRYNITNLSYLHFATVKSAYHRLKRNPIIDSNNVFFTGSTAIDSIYNFFKNPISINKLIPKLSKDEYVLMTFHSVTNSDESIDSVMSYSIEKIIQLGLKVLITYPNNDSGAEKILNVIKNWRNNDKIEVMKNLGAKGYYSAINDSKFVFGNSSSGIIEVPYFNKITINVGKRQDGRDMDKSIWNVPADKEELDNILKKGESLGWNSPQNEYLYGKGNSCNRIKDIIIEKFYKN